jgi:glycosyltransferase A (GT-A) superfamily protein (DUF2064 family)
VNGGAAIFVKTPGLSPVKTRLAAGIGVAAAEAWHRLAADAVAAVVGAVPGLAGYWAVAEAAPEAAGAWPGLPLLEQGGGELGERMGRVLAMLLARHDFALLLGADTPQLDPADLAEALDWLAAAEPRLVMGPARDGGFWLLGANRNPAPADWLRAPCGRADTARGFLEAMARHGAWRMLPALTDVDEAHDLAAMLAEMARLEHARPEQHRLAEWTRALRSPGHPTVP